MELVEDVVIVGGGIAGLATSLGLHRLGIRSLVLESAESMRTTGFAFAMWSNAWRAADTLGIGDILRAKSSKIHDFVFTSVNSGLTISELLLGAEELKGDREVRCVYRNLLLETLANELPKGTIRYSSKVVQIETDDDDHLKIIHLADGTIITTKVLIGSDGVYSVVAKFLGFSPPAFVGRTAARGYVYYETGHGFGPKFMHFFGKGVKFGITPVDDKALYWFFNFIPDSQADKELEHDPSKLKQFILRKLGKVSDQVREVFEKTDLKYISCAPLRYRRPFELLWGNICKDNVCVIGDALHTMTPDLGQGACCAMEDSVLLARFLGEAMKAKGNDETRRIKNGLEKFAKERRWRCFDLMITAYVVGWVQTSDWFVVNFVRDKIIANYLTQIMINKCLYDCGKLTSSS